MNNEWKLASVTIDGVPVDLSNATWEMGSADQTDDACCSAGPEPEYDAECTVADRAFALKYEAECLFHRAAALYDAAVDVENDDACAGCLQEMIDDLDDVVSDVCEAYSELARCLKRK